MKYLEVQGDFAINVPLEDLLWKMEQIWKCLVIFCREGVNEGCSRGCSATPRVRATQVCSLACSAVIGGRRGGGSVCSTNQAELPAQQLNSEAVLP